MSSIARVRVRRGTAAAWTAANPTLALGEIAAETDTLRFKVGTGSATWTTLPYYGSTEADLVRGQVSKMDSGTIDIVTQSVYVSTGLTGTFDTATANGMTLGTTNAFAVKNTSGATKLMQIYGSIDAKTASGNNKVLGIKLAKNGTAIDQTECRAFTGSGAEEAKLVTNWMISMAANDEVALFIANHSGTENISFGRGRLVATEVR
jgi:hypothetical protein